ncbi:nucleotidyltransferase domain-containing protein [archaeon]|nr:nucleotidyltransferase domain-containing protein [archaeon]
MDIYKLKFTILQQEILRFLFIKSGQSFTQNQMANLLNVSPTAVSKSLPGLESLIQVEKDKSTKRLSITLNKENPAIFRLKRIENLKLINESGLIDFLSEKMAAKAIILFGSYSRGEDTITSDIDIAIIGGKEKQIDLSRFAKLLEREINLNYYDSLDDIDKNLRQNLINGIVMEGAL